MLTASEIRQQFIDFFVDKHGHTFVPSSSVVPHDDPTLLFTNAGMNQFKDVFLGAGTRDYKRAANTQKCIRAGGKHNDLDDVGKDTYHHTFFEMLGNWSFGDYFKREAIQWAWELLTEVWGLEKDRLHATVFEGNEKDGVEPDNEARELWLSETDIDPNNVHWGDKKDNFWEMGSTGPCGPCSEIHIDLTHDKSGRALVNAGRPEAIEIWNLVFIQFNRDESARLTALPAKHVDTGMGFERITAVIQKRNSNYDTDVFKPLFESIQQVTGAPPYGGRLEDSNDVAYRVIADHVRALTFSLNDGGVPSNEKGGFVIRSILRRAERYGYQCFETREPFVYKLVPTVVDVMDIAFPELKRNPSKIQEVVLAEEKSFLTTLDRGMTLFQEVVSQTRGRDRSTISGKDAFDLHTTYGLFVDITQQMAQEVGMTVDRDEHERLMDEHRKKSGEGRQQVVLTAVQGELPQTDDSPKYRKPEIKAKVFGWIKDNQVHESGSIANGEEVALLVDSTNFYAEQGGQVGDTGTIVGKQGTFVVADVQKLGDTVLHVGRMSEGTINVGERVALSVSEARRHTMRNHTATHLLNWALREVLGDHVEQKGSLVDADRTRFDFTHDKPLSRGEVDRIEALVNEKIYNNLPVTTVTMPLESATGVPGVRAVFGEKYPDPVRVLLIGPKKPERATREDSVEFCGGTHLKETGEAGFFKIVSQELVAGGVRRVTAVTGKKAVEAVQETFGVVDELKSRLNCKPDEMLTRFDAMQEQIKKLQQQLKKGAAGDLQGAADQLLANAVEINGAKIITGEMPAPPDVEQMRQQMDRLRQKAKSAVIVLGWADDGKVGLLSAVTEDLTEKGAHAGKLIGEVAKLVGGGGGGKPTMAQAGGKDPSKLAEALQHARTLAEQQLRG